MAGTLTTPNDLITLCLRTAGVCGVGQTPEPMDVNDCFTILNSMIGQWNRNRWLIYHLVDVSCPSTGAQSYTVGSGEDFDVARPDRLETAYARLTNNPSNMPFDYQMSLIPSREDYSAIALKQLQTFPCAVWYDSDWPTGRVYFYPVPNTQFELHIVVKETLTTFPSIVTQINLPPEYTDALIWNLSARIRPLYQLPPEPSIVAFAKSSLNTLRQANAQVPLLNMPNAVLNNRSGYDVTLGNLNGLPFAV